MKTHRDLDVWKVSFELVVDLYKGTSNFPKTEQFGLTQQIRRSAVSVPSNISEGYARESIKERIRFLYIALGSNAELETQLKLSNRLGYLEDPMFRFLLEENQRIGKMLTRLIQYSKRKQS